MFKVKPLAREEIDSWQVATSGLPVRVVNGARHAHIDTIGQIRKRTSQELASLRAIGRISVRRIHRFLELCNNIEHGTQVFLTLQEVFDLFLDKEEMAILSRRYGLMRPDPKAAANFMTLQEIGNELHLTRERIRQVENIAIRNMKSQLAKRCLQPFYLYVRAFIKSRDGVVSCHDIMDLEDQSWLTGYNPCSVLLLLHDLNPSEYAEYHGIFSVMPVDKLDAATTAAKDYLSKSKNAIPIADLTTALNDHSRQWSARALERLLDHTPDIAATTDGRYFIYESGCTSFLLELMKQTSLPAHYRTLTHLFNERLKPAHRKGSGYILKVLNASPQFVKTERGQYTIDQNEPARASEDARAG